MSYPNLPKDFHTLSLVSTCCIDTAFQQYELYSWYDEGKHGAALREREGRGFVVQVATGNTPNEAFNNLQATIKQHGVPDRSKL